MMLEDQITARGRQFSAGKKALLEKRLRGGQSPAPAGRPAAIPRRVAGSKLPLSFAQQRLWFFDQLEPDSPLYNLPVAWRLRGRLNCDALKKAIQLIVARHEALRTRFQSEDGDPEQIIVEPPPIRLTIVDLSPDEEVLRVWLDTEAKRPLDLSRGTVLRVSLARLEENDHVLLVNLHHIISDAWSLGVFSRELALLYAACHEGREPELPELLVQYADFAVWQRKRLQGETLEKLLAFWRKHLAGAPQLLELPTDRPRPVTQSFRGGHVGRLLSKPLLEALKQIGRAEGATLYMTLLTAFKVLLHRYTRQTHLVVGSPIAGRNQLETEGLIGFFVNTLALHTDLSGNPPFREALARVRQVVLDGFTHQELPFEKLVENLQPARSSGYSPIVQVLFVLQGGMERGFSLPELAVEPLRAGTDTSKFDLTLAVEEWSDGLFIEVEYSADLFEEATIVRLLGHFQTLLEGIVANPAQTIGDLPWLTDAERAQLLVEWSGAGTDYPRDRTIPQLFEEQVKKAPEAVAVSLPGRQLTYHQLNEQANELADQLQTLGVKPGTMVAVCLDRSLELIVALLGILKAGGAYVSLEPVQPKDRLVYMLKDAGAPVLLTRESLRERFKSEVANLKIVCVDDASSIGSEHSTLQREHFTLNPESPAYISFTSGSTGRPKGVVVPHRGVVRLTQATHYVHFGPEETFLQLAPVAFDASTFEIWGALLNGAKLVVFPPHTPSLSELGMFIQKNRITTLWLTAGLFHQMIEEQLESLKGVRQLLAGGDVLSVPQVKRALDNLPGCRLINGYGPTENTTFTCCHEISTADSEGRSIPIGRPIANTQVYVLDDRLQPVPIGVPGQLYAGGDGLALGYLNRPELTAEKFIVNPYSYETKHGQRRAREAVEAGERLKFEKTEPTRTRRSALLYRTGDLVRWRADGTIEFLGRIDQQVKIRGFRVEPEEIETVMREHPMVKECAVVAREEVPGDKRLVAYVVPAISRCRSGTSNQADGSNPEFRAATSEKEPSLLKSVPRRYDIQNGSSVAERKEDLRPLASAAAEEFAELRQFLNRRLPDYMMPVSWVALESLPLNGNGKVDRRALPSPEHNISTSPNAFVAPRNPLEQQLADIWKDVLGIPRVGVEDHFFHLGGHSLLAVRLVARIEKVLGRKIPVAAVFQSPTVAQLAKALRQTRASSVVSSLVGIQPRGSRPPLFFVHGVGGGMFWGYTNLSRHLGSDQPLYGFNSRGMVGQEEFETIEEMAAQYVADLQKFQPHGPYFLGGYCFGGNVAYEMARQLRARGEPVALLALINCAPPNASYARFRLGPMSAFKFVKNLGYWAGYLMQLEPVQRREFFLWKLRVTRKRLQRLFRRSKVDVEEIVDLAAQPEDRRKLWEAHVRALIAHRTRPYHGRVTLFRTRGHPILCSFDGAFGWREFAADVVVRIIPGAHESALDEPHVRALAASLECQLAEINLPLLTPP